MSQNTCKITTTAGLNGAPLTTELGAGQSIRDWVNAHRDALGQATATGDPLVTDWDSKSGGQSVTTPRAVGPPLESLESLKASHVTDFLLGMIEEQPTI